jgi:hypothetical protein
LLQEEVEFSDGGAGAPTRSIPVQGTALGKLGQSITFPGIANVVYGAGPVALMASSSSGLSVSYKVVSGPALLASNGKSLTINGVGTVVVMATQAGNGSYSAAANVTESFQVTPALLTVTATNVSATYGSVPAAFTYSISGFVLGQSASQVVTGKPIVQCAATTHSGVGKYAIAVTQGTLNAVNYSFVFVAGQLTVTKATLTITPNAASSVYGEALPAFTYQISGLVAGDSASSAFKGAPALTSQATAKARPGTYRISAGAGSMLSTNYSFEFATGTLTIAKAVLTVTPVAASMIYGANVPSFHLSLSGFVNGDTATLVSGEPAFKTVATKLSAVGEYAVTASLGTLASSSYTFQFAAGTLNVTPALLTVSASNLSMKQGASVPNLTYKLAGLVNGDSAVSAISGVPILTTASSSASKPGSYPIAIAVGTMKASNYQFTFLNGTLTVTQ